jgi:NADPH-dependent glutamate synthase beta subunit-like oxidoreductase
MPSPDRDYEKLAQTAKRRRAELGLALNDKNAKAGGLSNRTWQRVEKGLEIRETNYVKIDRLLQWAPGSCIAVLEGGEPVPVADMADADAASVQKSPLPQDVIDEEVRDTVQLALIATAKGTTAEEIREMSERVVRDLRERGLI